MTRENGSRHYGLSPLAGVSAGTAAVLFAFGVLALAWHRVAGQVSVAVTVLVYVAAGVACGLAAAVLAYAALWLRHRVRHPELMARQAVTAEAAAPVTPPAVGAARPAAIDPPRVYVTVTPDQFAALIRGQPARALPAQEER